MLRSYEILSSYTLNKLTTLKQKQKKRSKRTQLKEPVLNNFVKNVPTRNRLRSVLLRRNRKVTP